MSQYLQTRIARITTKKVPVLRPASERAYVFQDDEPTRVVPLAEMMAKVLDARAASAEE